MSEAGSREPWRALEVYVQQWRWKASRGEEEREKSSVCTATMSSKCEKNF